MTATTKNKENYKDQFTINTGKWLESKGFDPEKIYKALNNEIKIETLNKYEKQLVGKEGILKRNSKTGKWYKPIGLKDDLTNQKNIENENKLTRIAIKENENYEKKETTKKRPKKIFEPELVSIKDAEKISHEKLEKVFGEKITKSIIKWSEHYKIDPVVLSSIIVAEHSGSKDKNRAILVGNKLKRNPNYYAKQTSTFGTPSHGLMQFTKDTLQGLSKGKHSLEEVVSDYDLSIKYAAKFTSYLSKSNKGDFEKIVFAYNAGGGTLSKLETEGKEKNKKWKEIAKEKVKAYYNPKGRINVGLGYIEKAKEAREQIFAI